MSVAQVLAVNLRDVSFSYRDRDVLNHVTTRFQTGVTCVLGINGAGKSTLLKLIAGTRRPTGGEVCLFPPTLLKAAVQPVGYMPQTLNSTRLLTALAYVQYFSLLKGVGSSASAASARHALDAVGLSDRQDDRTSKLSGGMMRRLGLAAAICGEPPILLLDEPTSGLDPVQRIEILELVTGLGPDHVIVLATHLLEDVRQVADRVLVLDGGRIAFDGTSDEFEVDPELHFGLDTTNLRGTRRGRNRAREAPDQ